ncbi:MAG: SUMF1/EgtB/PvdO family nonheme iron enzyme [Methylocystaceae bacterium]|nr:SUMF1/EgtB/PvdO family nonheme iron enzyme [Methylocystaceae bacterium]
MRQWLLFGLGFVICGLVFSFHAKAGGVKKSEAIQSQLLIMVDGPEGKTQCIELPDLNRGGWLKVNHLRPGQEPLKTNILLNAGQNFLNLSSQSSGIGQFSLDITPSDAIVYMNGKRLSGALQNLSAPVGFHQIRVQKENYYTKGSGIAITPCGSANLSIRLQKIAPRPEVKKTVEKVSRLTPVSGETFKDCSTCPEMIALKPGHFTMGAVDGGVAKDAFVRDVTINKPFAVSMFEITFDQWDACVRDGGCGGYSPKDNGWGRAGHPVIHVSWNDAQAYLDWISKKTGQSYRLLSEAEWEYAARAGSNTSYSWGDDLGSGRANCANCGSKYDALETAPVGTFKANDFGLFDTTGNVWEWVSDCYEQDAYQTYQAYPKPYAPSKSCNRVLRGGAWDLIGQGATTAFRFNANDQLRSNAIGFRIARDLQE